MTVQSSNNFNDIIGRAMERYHRTGEECMLRLWINDEPEPAMPVSSFFRELDAMSELQREALQRTSGRVLDVGAGAGCHSLALQERGLEVTALDHSPSAASVLRERGIKRVVCSPILDYSKGAFDTVLLLMNGFGIAGNCIGLEALLRHLKALLAPGGRILADSTNLVDFEERMGLDLTDGYFGEVMFRLEDEESIDEFPWIYPDEFLLEGICEDLELGFEVVSYGEDGAFLCEITLRH